MNSMTNNVILRKLIKKLWESLRNNHFLRAFVELVCKAILNFLPRRVFRNAGEAAGRTLFLLALGAGDVLRAAETLEHMRGFSDNRDLAKFYGLGLASVAFRAGSIREILMFFQNAISRDPSQFWAWRVLIDANAFLLDWDAAFSNYLEFLEVQREVKRVNDLPQDLHYYGNNVISSFGHTLILWDFYLAKILAGVETGARDTVLVDRGAVANDDLILLFGQFYEVKGEAPKLLETWHRDFLENEFRYFLSYKGQWLNLVLDRQQLYSDWFSLHSGSPRLILPSAIREPAVELLSKFGLTAEDWYVVLHVKQSYDGDVRNSEVSTYMAACEEVSKRGGWVFRIGDPAMPRIPKMTRVVDLATDPIIGNKLDVYLLATARFAIVTNSGPAELPMFFEVPRLLTNYAHLRHLTCHERDLLVPKPVYNRQTQCYLSLHELWASDIASSHLYLQDSPNLMFVDNTEDEILESTREMLERFEVEEAGGLLQGKINARIHGAEFPINCKLSDYFVTKYPGFSYDNYRSFFFPNVR